MEASAGKVHSPATFCLCRWKTKSSEPLQRDGPKVGCAPGLLCWSHLEAVAGVGAGGQGSLGGRRAAARAGKAQAPNIRRHRDCWATQSSVSRSHSSPASVLSVQRRQAGRAGEPEVGTDAPFPHSHHGALGHSRPLSRKALPSIPVTEASASLGGLHFGSGRTGQPQRGNQ